MQFYGDVDRNHKGEITSQYPAWTQRVHIGNLQEQIASTHRRIENGLVPPEDIPQHKAEMAAMQRQMEEITRSKPDVSVGERDRLQKLYKQLSRGISAAMFTRSEMKMGTADPHEEARRMTEPCIDATKEIAEITESCKVVITKGKITRNGAAKIFKIVGHLLDEPTNIEVLRKDKVTQRRRAN